LYFYRVPTLASGNWIALQHEGHLNVAAVHPDFDSARLTTKIREEMVAAISLQISGAGRLSMELAL
jgi:hypothetical protein